MKLDMFVRTVALPGAAVLSLAAASQAGIVYGFDYCVTNNNPVDVQTGTAQLTVEVSDAGAAGVEFTFRNGGPGACSITDLYWDDGTLLALGSITSGPGTEFEPLASPQNLPGGANATPPFEVTAGFSADASGPAQLNGVNPGEFVTVRYLLQGSQTYAHVIDDLATGALRIGIHVQGFAGGGSEGFINGGTPVPAPAGAVAVLGAIGLGAARRRRR